MHAATGQQAADRVAGLLDIAGTARHAELIAACLDRLGVFRLSRQLRTLDQILRRLTDALFRVSAPRRYCWPLGSWPVDRIAIIGCGGSGKSRLARALGGMLGITPVHLDGLYYDRDWKPLDKEQFAALQRDLVAAPRWIIDGNYASSLPVRLQAADTVIFLDLPAWACLWGIIQRRLRHGGGQHDAIGVYDRITWNFIRYIAGYRKQMAPRVRQLIADHAGDAQVVVLRSRRAARRYLAGVAAPGSALPRRWLPVRSAASPFTDPAQVRGVLYASADRIAQRTRSPAPCPGNRPARW